MILPRPDVFRAVLRTPIARASRPAVRLRPCRQIGRRTYASHGGHGVKKSGSDLPWLIGAVTVTVPTCAYLLQPGSKDHGHGHGAEGHGEEGEQEEHEEHEEHEGHEEAPEGEDAAKTSSEGEDGDHDESELKGDEAPNKAVPPNAGEGDQEDGNDSEKSEDSDGGEEGQQDTPDTSDDESSKNVAHKTGPGGDVEGVQFKGATKDGAAGDTRKHIPDAKGGNKKRIESDYGVRQGAADDEPMRDAEGSPKDKAAASKAPLSQNQQSGKQEHISNSDTKHSTDLTSNPEKSTKGEGTPETSKSKGTVDPSRPQK